MPRRAVGSEYHRAGTGAWPGKECVNDVDKVGDRVRRGLNRGRLAKRLAELEAEIQECRQVNLRLAELTDVVAELLLPIADRDEERIQQALASYRASVGGPMG
jgi:hypothetical protein